MVESAVQTRHLTGGVVRVCLCGAIEGAAIDRLRTVLVDLLMRRRPASVAIDTQGATSIDSTALGVLFAAIDVAGDLGIPVLIDSLGGYLPAAG